MNNTSHIHARNKWQIHSKTFKQKHFWCVPFEDILAHLVIYVCHRMKLAGAKMSLQLSHVERRCRFCATRATTRVSPSKVLCHTKPVTANLKSKQLLSFVFVLKCFSSLDGHLYKKEGVKPPWKELPPEFTGASHDGW